MLVRAAHHRYFDAAWVEQSYYILAATALVGIPHDLSIAAIEVESLASELGH